MCIVSCRPISEHKACVNNIQADCGSADQKTQCRCGPGGENCLTCSKLPKIPAGVCTDPLCTCSDADKTTCTGCIDSKNYRLFEGKCMLTPQGKCGSCLLGYVLKDEKCQECVEGDEKIGDFCFLAVIPSRNLSRGAVAGILVAILVIVGAVGGGLAFYFIKK
uniref:Cysteine-rich membrane protein 2 n=1 Tax=Spironucleus salmonicida TaxID=348837 RepID=V6LD39_9EUKA|eukprot:EST42382.1 Cysteine-rich membrane protein 2 [Spironucleus salmonicida]